MKNHKEKKSGKEDRLMVTHKEMNNLAREISLFKQKEINGKLISSVDQYLCSINVRKVDENGLLVCLQPDGDYKLGKINAALEYREYIQFKKDIDRDPEEKRKFLKRVFIHRPKLADLTKKFSI